MIYIYSGDVPELDEQLLEELGDGHRVLVVSYNPKDVGVAKEAQACLQQAGLRAKALPRRIAKDVDKLAYAVMSSDAVYLTGGNTYEFLDYARDVGLFELLREFEADGGIIIGESAGSIILSPDISTAAVPSGDPDENTVGLEDLRGMDRIPYHISPHYEPESPRAPLDRDELQALADASGVPVVMLRDGEGMVLKDWEPVRFTHEARVLYPVSQQQPQSVFDGAA